MGIDRRTALKVIAAGGAAAACSTLPAQARTRAVAPAGAMGMLYDTTRCIGCKSCVVACKQANDLPAERGPFDEGRQLYDAPLDLDGNTKNVIKLYSANGQQSYVKAQCMHCVDPACAAACMLKSLHKDEVTGIVSYDPAYCVGCRYCQMACPFNVPKFEFGKSAPKIVKCELCRHRVKDSAEVTASGFTRYPVGQGPACCEVCPREAVIYGKRDELLQDAKSRIAANPGRYYKDHAYGETEAGGTQVLYLSHLPFAAIGLPSVGDEPVPEVAYSVQDGIYYKLPFIAPVGLYAVLAAVMIRNRRAEEHGGGEGGAA
jgi:Fe-S-cluster-containing dehydrogenase component